MNWFATSIFFIIILVAVGGGFCLYDYMQEKTIVATVNKKFIDVGKEGSHYVLITDKGMLEVDRPWWMVFNLDANADLNWGKISEGKTYTFYTVGWSIDWLYWYPIVFKVS